MNEAPSPPPAQDCFRRTVAAAHAIGALDGALATSPVARFWRERAGIVGLADCLALAGASLTPAEFFRGTVGLVEPVFFDDLDRHLIAAVIAEALPDLVPGSLTARLLARLQGSRLLPGDEWTADRRPSAAMRRGIADTLIVTRADVGTALAEITKAVAGALTALRSQMESGDDWHGWLIAAQLPATLARAGITATPLPCLTGLGRGMRYATLGADAIEAQLLPRLAEQASEGLALLRRLEACARAWRGRLAGLTARSRAGQAAGVFMVWPACTRPQLAAALGVTAAGAGKLLEVLVTRDIVERRVFNGTAFYLAPESLGEFKLEARQGRQIAAPRLDPLIAELDAAMAALDVLGIDFDGGLPGIGPPDDREDRFYG